MLAENKPIFDYINLNQYHEKGYTGKGQTVIIFETASQHGLRSQKHLLTSAPDCTPIFVNTSLTQEQIYNFIVDSGAKIVTHSLLSLDLSHELSSKLIEQGVVLITAAGNEGVKGITECSKDDNWISVGALNLVNDKPVLMGYSSRGEGLDTVAFMPYTMGGLYAYQDSGTSFTTPFFAGMLACFNQCRGVALNQEDLEDMLKLFSVDLGEVGVDTSYGNGVLVLPTIKEYIVIHHSAGADGVARDFDAIRRYHMEERGYRDIGYHWVVERVNSVLQAIPGRSEYDDGAHCPGRNKDGIGVCIVGDFTDHEPDAETYAFVGQLCKQIADRHPIKEIGGHKDYYATSCPGMVSIAKTKEAMKVEDIKGRWSEEDIKLVVSEGLMQGFPDGQFKPAEPVTREQLAVVLARLIKKGVI